jgi:hypothetical protein
VFKIDHFDNRIPFLKLRLLSTFQFNGQPPG